MVDLLLGYLTADAAEAGATLVAAALVLLQTGCDFQATAVALAECWVGQSMRVLRTEGEGAGGGRRCGMWRRCCRPARRRRT
jgi:hypothetical protein